MARKLRSYNRTTAATPTAQGNGSEAQSPEVAHVLVKVKQLLDDQCPDKALEVISRSRLASPWITNAAGVCQLRLGNARQAVSAFQSLVVVSAVLLKRDAPMVFKTNYAVALLASDNLPGCLSVLNEIHEEQNATVQQIRAAIQRWKQSLSFWQKVRWYLGDDPRRKVAIDFPLGEVQ
jgi:hypothetical protein